jgi:hypothetical protein
MDLQNNLQIENYHNNTPAEYEEYVKPDPDTHGKSGYAISLVKCLQRTCLPRY